MKRFLFATLLCAVGHCAFGADTDGDGLLDVLDAPGFDANAIDVDLSSRGIQDLDGANLLANATWLGLWGNRITSVENGDFQGLSNLQGLDLSRNQITSLGSGAFQGLNNLQRLRLGFNPIKRLNLTGATFDALEILTVGSAEDLILDDALLSLGSFEKIVTLFISDVSLVGMAFSDSYPTNLSGLLNLATLDNVRVDQALFDRYAAEFTAFDAIPDNTVTVVPEPSAFLLCTAVWILGWAFRQGRIDQASSLHSPCF